MELRLLVAALESCSHLSLHFFLSHLGLLVLSLLRLFTINIAHLCKEALQLFFGWRLVLRILILGLKGLWLSALTITIMRSSSAILGGSWRQTCHSRLVLNVLVIHKCFLRCHYRFPLLKLVG